MLQLVLLFFIGIELDLHAIYWIIWGVAFTIESRNLLNGMHVEYDEEDNNK